MDKLEDGTERWISLKRLSILGAGVLALCFFFASLGQESGHLVSVSGPLRSSCLDMYGLPTTCWQPSGLGIKRFHHIDTAAGAAESAGQASSLGTGTQADFITESVRQVLREHAAAWAMDLVRSACRASAEPGEDLPERKSRRYRSSRRVASSTHETLPLSQQASWSRLGARCVLWFEIVADWLGSDESLPLHFVVLYAGVRSFPLHAWGDCGVFLAAASYHGLVWLGFHMPTSLQCGMFGSALVWGVTGDISCTVYALFFSPFGVEQQEAKARAVKWLAKAIGDKAKKQKIGKLDSAQCLLILKAPYLDSLSIRHDDLSKMKALLRELVGLAPAGDTQDSQDPLVAATSSGSTSVATPGALPSSSEALLPPAAVPATPSALPAAVSATVSVPPPAASGASGAACRDGHWHDAVLIAKQGAMWLVRDTDGREWLASNFYQAGDVTGSVAWIPPEFQKAGKRLVDFGAGNGNDCWYLCAEAALNELGEGVGPPPQFRNKLAAYAREHVLPSYTDVSEGRDGVLSALTRIENGDMAETAEVKWTANLTGILILVHSKSYSTAAAANHLSPDMWTVIVPREREFSLDVTNRSCLEAVGGKYFYMHSDGNFHYQAYLNNSPSTDSATAKNFPAQASACAADASGLPSDSSVVAAPAPLPEVPAGMPAECHHKMRSMGNTECLSAFITPPTQRPADKLWMCRCAFDHYTWHDRLTSVWKSGFRLPRVEAVGLAPASAAVPAAVSAAAPSPAAKAPAAAAVAPSDLDSDMLTTSGTKPDPHGIVEAQKGPAPAGETEHDAPPAAPPAHVVSPPVEAVETKEGAMEVDFGKIQAPGSLPAGDDGAHLPIWSLAGPSQGEKCVKCNTCGCEDDLYVPRPQRKQPMVMCKLMRTFSQYSK